MREAKPTFTHIQRLASVLGTLIVSGMLLCSLAQAAGPPIVSAPSASAITETTAKLEGKVNPNQREVDLYFFEYVDQASFEANGFAEAQKTSSGTLPSAKEDLEATAQALGLKPGTTYRFRLVAHNVLGTTQGAPGAFRTYVTHPPYAPCANDTFRLGAPSAILPDCRAYEQASPADKNGGDVAGSTGNVHAAANGEAVNFMAFSPLPGSDSASTVTPLYLASRSSSGWSTQNMALAEAYGQDNTVAGWNPDLSQIFDLAGKLGEPVTEALFAKPSAGGSPVQITPYIPAFKGLGFAGTSADDSVVFLEAGGAPLTPNAVPGQPNLYVWDRDTATLRLAGVLNDEEAPPAGSVVGAYGWGSGTDPGALSQGGAERQYTQDIHAIAADGSSVYFTALKTGQLYLRRNPAQPQSPLGEGGECTDPDLACTVHVSASRKTNGPGGGSDPAGTQPAAFMGATPDGAHAFFTSSEMLTNDANTGPEQPPAQIGRAKIGAAEAEEVEAGFLPKHAVGLTVDPKGEYLYWADPQAGTIGRAKLNGAGKATEVDDGFIAPPPSEFETHPKTQPGVISSASRPRYVAVDDEYVYWTNTGPLASYGSGDVPVEGAGTIGRAKLNGTEPPLPSEVDSEFITGATNPQGIAVNSEHVYWTNGDAQGTSEELKGPGHWISRAAINGEAVELEFNRSYGIVPVPVALALDETYLYFSLHEDSGNNGYLDRIPLSGGTGEFVGIDRTRIDGLAIAGSEIYWTAEGQGAIGRRPLTSFTGSCAADPNCEGSYLDEVEGTLAGLASDGERLYWSVNGEAPSNPGNDLYRFDAASGDLTDLAPDSGDPNGAEVLGVLGSSDDGSYLYFVANGVLAPGASAGNCDVKKPVEHEIGTCNLYLDHEGQTSFIASLDAGHGDSVNWRSAARAGGNTPTPKTAWVSADGRTLLFTSADELTPNAFGEELYRYRVGAPEPLACVSCPVTGLSGGKWALVDISVPGAFSSQGAALLTRNLSADGNRVFFQTTRKLVAADTNGDEGCPVSSQQAPDCQDVYEWEAKGTGSCDWEAENGGCLYLISSGKSPQASYFLDASTSGEDVFFFTRSQLAPQDKDTLTDVYDARVGGGLASQHEPPPPPPCEGEACKRGATAPPQSGSPSTPLFSGPGNPKPHHKKPKPHKRHAKKHKHKHAKKQGRTHR